MLNIRVEGIKGNDTLRIIYIDENENITERLIKVIKISDEILTAYCYLRKARRTFKYSNILAIVPVKERVVV